jgi:DNA primase
MSGYKEHCPKCGAYAFYITPHNGLSYCFKCEYTEREGNKHKPEVKRTREEIQQIRSFYTRIAKYYHSCLGKEHREYLYRRGFTDDSIERYLIGYVPEDANNILYKDIAVSMSGLVHDGEAFLKHRIVFPYIKNGKVTDIRGRSLDPNDGLRYLSPKGSSKSRGAILPWNSDLDTDNVIVTEGEIAAGIATQAGFPTLGLPGINAKRKILSNRVIIIFDREQNLHVKKAILKVAERIENPFVSTLYVPNSLRGKKVDMDSFILAGGDMERVINAALPISEWRRLQERNI